MFQSFCGRAGDDLREMRLPLAGRLGFVMWEILFTSLTGVAGAIAPGQALWWERALWALGLGLVGAVVGLVVLYALLLPVAIWRQRAEARQALQLVSETPFAFTEREPFYVPPLGNIRVYSPLSIRNQGSERGTVEGLTAAVSLGFRREGTNWGTDPRAAVPSFTTYGPPDPSERSWRVKKNGLWELSGLPAVVRGGGELVLPHVGVEIVDESRVREEYQRPEGALLFLDVNIRSSIGTVRIRHTVPVIFADETGADLVASEHAS